MMNKKFIAKFAVVATVFLAGSFMASQISIDMSFGAWLNSTGATDVAVSLDPFITTLTTAITGIFCLASLIILIRDWLENRRWKKKYGENRTPVVFK
jgi:ABC-type Co2+ transport system permease subunit